MSAPWPDIPSGFADAADLIFDSWVLAHGQTEYVRDYDVFVALPAAKPHGPGSYIEGHYRVRFTHSPLQRCETALGYETWRNSWADALIDWDSWKAAGEPGGGFVWAQGASAYPGPSLVEDSPLATEWSNRTQREMYELKLETNAYVLSLLFHNLSVLQVAKGDPETGGMHRL